MKVICLHFRDDMPALHYIASTTAYRRSIIIGVSAVATHRMHIGAHAGLLSCKYCLWMQNLDAASLEPYVQRLQDHFCQGSKSGSDGGDDQV